MGNKVTIPTWKKYLSYLVEWHLESAPSEINPHLYVSLKRGRFQLSTANAVYSFGDLYDNFSKSFQNLQLERLPGKKVLLLGLGLGSIPYMLETKFNRRFQYTAVEIDESVIYLAEKYCLQFLDAPVETICTDAQLFLKQTSEQYDLIAMDVFLDDTVPGPFHTESFLLDLREHLRPGALLMYNRLAMTKKDKDATRDFFEGPFSSVFSDAAYLDVGGNWMLLNNSNLLI